LTEQGTQKLYFALWPDHATRAALQRIGRSLPSHGGRPTHPEDLHLTLVFLGQVEAERFDCVLRAADAVRVKPFELTIDRTGYWRRPKILWCGPPETPRALDQLVAELQGELQKCGFQPEDRPYSPHVTLARKSRPVEPIQLEEPLEWRVHEFTLVASLPVFKPPRYKVLRRWDLA
jgi:2'-5' RNA ligase